ncbi:MAG: type II toxin-antitoxin system VapC family toxin [Thermoleophilaceae bacterium]|nr:type II toxin-antitoxin system VapC family toxin [Thermoleophilaceae bacterium]
MVSVLDAWALLALLQGEPAAMRVQEAIAAGGGVVSWVNLGEVYYVSIRRRGAADAELALRLVLASVRAEDTIPQVTREAARLKALGGLSYADCFAIATARRHQAPLLTGDPEIIDSASGVEVIDLRLA